MTLHVCLHLSITLFLYLSYISLMHLSRLSKWSVPAEAFLCLVVREGGLLTDGWLSDWLTDWQLDGLLSDSWLINYWLADWLIVGWLTDWLTAGWLAWFEIRNKVDPSWHLHFQMISSSLIGLLIGLYKYIYGVSVSVAVKVTSQNVLNGLESFFVHWIHFKLKEMNVLTCGFLGCLGVLEFCLEGSTVFFPFSFESSKQLFLQLSTANY